MSIFVFLGPTLALEAAQQLLEAQYLPPVRTGDVYRVAKLQPQAIVIIDGYFDRVPAVWHKEILWAMQAGIHVFGASSMGALRAAELHAFGMEGMGRIFDDFASGVLQADDEVAVAHTRAEDGYQALSVAMVDLRATLQKALDDGLLTPTLHDGLIQHLKALYYPDRNYQVVISYLRDQGADADSFKAWLADNTVSQKQLDAEHVLRTVHERFQTPQAAKTVTYTFENTSMWENLQRNAGSMQLGGTQGGALTDDWILDELRLDQASYHRLMRLALLQIAANELVDPNPSPDGEDELVLFFQQRGIPAEHVQLWLAQNNLNPAGLRQIIADYAKIDVLTHERRMQITNTLPNMLKLSGMYPQLAQRAYQKQQRLQENYLEMPSLVNVGIDLNTLYRWYFVEQRGLPDVPDVAQYAQLSGFQNETQFKRALLREYCLKVALQ